MTGSGPMLQNGETVYEFGTYIEYRIREYGIGRWYGWSVKSSVASSFYSLQEFVGG